MGGKISKITDGIDSTIQDIGATIESVRIMINDLRHDAMGTMENLSNECIESIRTIRLQGERTAFLLTNAVLALIIAVVLGLLLHLSHFSVFLRTISWIMYAAFCLHMVLTYIRHYRSAPSSISSHEQSRRQENVPYRNVALETTITQCENPLEIDLTGLELNDEDMPIVVNQAIVNQQCTSLRFSSNRITSKGVKILANALLKNQTLEQLSFWKNQLGDAGVSILCEKLSISRGALKKLDLSDNHITDIGAEHLAKMLRTNQILTYLSLSDNDITDKGVQSLAHTLQHRNRTLQRLSITGNKLVTDACVDSLIKMIKDSRSLQKVWINDCNISKTGEDKLRQVAKQKKEFRCYM